MYPPASVESDSVNSQSRLQRFGKGVRSRINRNSLLAVSGLLLLVLGVWGWRTWQVRVSDRTLPASESVTPQITTITALARLLPEGEIINVSAPTSGQESRVAELSVAVGDKVAAGEVVATLDNEARLLSAVASAERQVDIARAQLAQVEAGTPAGDVQAQQAEIARIEADVANNLASQRATISRLEAELANAAADFNRYEQLYQRGGISASERDSRRLTLSVAEQNVREAQASLRRTEETGQAQIAQARATLDRLATVRPVDVEAARADVQAAIAAVAEAEANLEQVYVRAPQAGTVIEIHTRPGEVVDSEGVVTLGQTEQMMAVAEVYQDDVSQVGPGQSVVLTSTAFSGELTGEVDRIGLEVGQQTVIDSDPSANIDAKVVEVHVRLDEASSERVEGLSNLQVTATIQVD